MSKQQLPLVDIGILGFMCATVRRRNKKHFIIEQQNLQREAVRLDGWVNEITILTQETAVCFPPKVNISC